jgi:hypothetical protein
VSRATQDDVASHGTVMRGRAALVASIDDVFADPGVFRATL